jgi:hypothetical protein
MNLQLNKAPSKQPLVNFWNWFVDHEEELLTFESDRERIFDMLATELNKIDPALCFELGPNDPRIEFVISAGGIKSAFPAVSALVDAAPTLERWQITAFRPRRMTINSGSFAERV